ncbi:TlpA disulfide reductase family protein [Hymenobacter ginsengisoli]|uniref:TlpA disulfide reductase family protein n=1 Tax=Hymenobacter ginsengisoli TaxID=1051626 RepID=A0ABP8PTS0_9BACT|nr:MULTISPECIES: TlpA disulfide reductase family protein [unclassified Hymenobacter]MBO2033752.1 AhpC/TSA family protein [Hymenobacter sp. BT559]
MKKIGLVVLTLLPAVALAQSTDFRIMGQIGHVSSPAKVYLEYRQAGREIVDSATIRNGFFEFRGKIKAITPATLRLDKAGTSLQKASDRQSFFMEPGVIHLANDADSLGTATIGGTPTNRENAAYNQALKPVAAARAAIAARTLAATPAQRESTAFKKELDALNQQVVARAIRIRKEFIQAHPVSFLNLTLITQLAYYTDYAEVAPIFNALPPALRASEDGKVLGAQIASMKHVALGSVATDFALTDTSGAVVRLSSLRGRYVLLDFWGASFSASRQENQRLVQLFARFKNQRFTILSISVEEPTARAQWLAAIRADNLTWPQVADINHTDNAVADLYGVKGLPLNFLLDPNGRVIARNLHGDALEAKLMHLLLPAEKREN